MKSDNKKTDGGGGLKKVLEKQKCSLQICFVQSNLNPKMSEKLVKFR